MAELLAAFRKVLRTHRYLLPEPMRALGDGYVRDEFRRVRDKLARGEMSNTQWREFLSQWDAYCSALAGESTDEALRNLVDSAGHLRQSVVSSLSDDQRSRLQQLQSELNSHQSSTSTNAGYVGETAPNGDASNDAPAK